MISIVMPARNAGLYLNDCLSSIQAQTYTDWELIAIDDHSTDDTADILEQFAQQDRRIHWCSAHGKGIIDALRQASENLNSKYITRMDADDLMSRNKLEKMHQCLIENGHGTIAVGLVEYFSDSQLGQGYKRYADWLNGLTVAENNFTEIYKECVIPSPCWMVHMEDFYLAKGFESEVYPEDYDLCFRFRNAGLTIKAVPYILHHWRDHSRRASRNDPNYLDNRFLELKIHHFLKSDFDRKVPLFVWGAGKKGKQIVKLLQRQHVPHQWICNNPNKIGKDIYAITLQDTDSLNCLDDAQIIVAVANDEEQQLIKSKLLQRKGFRPFFFC